MINKSFMEVNKEHLQALAELPEDQELLMLNLLRYKDRVEETGLTGETAYKQYMMAASPFFEKVDAEIVFFGSPELMLIGPEDQELWDDILLVKYRNAGEFFKMTQAKGYPSELREQSLQDSRLIYCKPHIK
ncbi:MAG: DUF1330 domain-containing protein [Eudoraea sp.]|nr:hypothetical protein [Eudoraea sp.]NNL01401.1 DUF1330 domain-containing protein [Eudoraea sp.]